MKFVVAALVAASAAAWGLNGPSGYSAPARYGRSAYGTPYGGRSYRGGRYGYAAPAVSYAAPKRQVYSAPAVGYGGYGARGYGRRGYGYGAAPYGRSYGYQARSSPYGYNRYGANSYGYGGLRGMRGLPNTRGIGGRPGLRDVGGLPDGRGIGGRPGLRDVGGLPDGRGIGGRPGLRDVGGLPDARGIGGKPGLNDVGGLPDAPGVAGKPGLTDVGGLPDARGIAGKPGLTDVGGLPDARGVSGRPGLTDVGGLPDSRGVSGRPGLRDFGGLPDSRGVGGRPGLRDFAGLPDARGIGGRPGLRDQAGLPDTRGMTGNMNGLTDVYGSGIYGNFNEYKPNDLGHLSDDPNGYSSPQFQEEPMTPAPQDLAMEQPDYESFGGAGEFSMGVDKSDFQPFGFGGNDFKEFQFGGDFQAAVGGFGDFGKNDVLDQPKAMAAPAAPKESKQPLDLAGLQNKRVGYAGATLGMPNIQGYLQKLQSSQSNKQLDADH